MYVWVLISIFVNTLGQLVLRSKRYKETEIETERNRDCLEFIKSWIQPYLKLIP